MTFHIGNAFDIVCRLDRDDILDKTPQNKKQKVASCLLLDKLHKQDFAGPLSGRAARVLGPISGHRIADILLHMKRVSCASRPGLLVGFLRILCNGLCTAQTFTLRKTIILALLDVWMNLTPSLTALCGERMAAHTGRHCPGRGLLRLPRLHGAARRWAPFTVEGHF